MSCSGRDCESKKVVRKVLKNSYPVLCPTVKFRWDKDQRLFEGFCMSFSRRMSTCRWVLSLPCLVPPPSEEYPTINFCYGGEYTQGEYT